MRIKQVNGKFIAYLSSGDVINFRHKFSKLEVSKKVIDKLKEINSEYLAEDYWYLGINKYQEDIIWAISIAGATVSPIIKGFLDDRKVMVLEKRKAMFS